MNTNGTFRYKLLAGVAACALLLAVEGTPARAEPAQNWWLTFRGQVPTWEENDGDTSRRGNGFSLGEGYGIGGEFGWKIDDIHSIVTRVNINRRSNNQETVYASYYSSGRSFESGKNNTFVADLEIGRDVGLGALGMGEGDLRAFAGVRVAHLTANSESSFSNYTSFAGDTTRRSFTGAGPRIGFTASKPLSEQVAFDLSAAGGVLIGRQKESFEANGYYSSFNNDDSRTAVVPNVEASAALKFLFNEDTTFSAGYKVDAYFNALGNFGGDKSDRIIHGPFVQFTIKN